MLESQIHRSYPAPFVKLLQAFCIGVRTAPESDRLAVGLSNLIAANWDLGVVEVKLPSLAGRP